MSSLDFVVVGTPRSGTTLLQRLACELPGVRMPAETHFLSLFADGLLRRRRFPLDRDTVLAEVAAYNRLPQAAQLGLAPESVADLTPLPATLMDLFAAVVRAAAGPGDVVGEKTPSHLLWLRPLARAFPQLRVVAIVRDPRAVVASNLQVPWGMGSPAVLAERWAADQVLIGAAARELGDRCLAVRYEDVVADPAGVRQEMARLLGVPAVAGTTTLPSPPEPWKQRAVAPVDDSRADVWRDVLSPATAATVMGIARRGLRAVGHGHDPAGGLATARRLARLTPADQGRRVRFRLARRRTLAAIDQLVDDERVVGPAPTRRPAR